MRTLKVTSGPEQGRTLEIEGDVVLGRENADLVVPDSEISRRHAVVREVERGVEIEDLGSLNGTFVNGERITTPVTLTSSGALRVGTTEMEIEVTLPADVTRASPIASPDVTVTRDVPDVTAVRTAPPRTPPSGPPPGADVPPGGPPPGVQVPAGGPPPGVQIPPGGPPPGSPFPPGGPPPGVQIPPGGPPPGVQFPPGGPPPGVQIPPGGFPPGGPPPGIPFPPGAGFPPGGPPTGLRGLLLRIFMKVPPLRALSPKLMTMPAPLRGVVMLLVLLVIVGVPAALVVLLLL